jgi:hypothetical protein
MSTSETIPKKVGWIHRPIRFRRGFSTGFTVFKRWRWLAFPKTPRPVDLEACAPGEFNAWSPHGDARLAVLGPIFVQFGSLLLAIVESIGYQ